MKYYLGVDGGGTKTIAVISDQFGRVHGIGYGGNSNHQINQKVAGQELEQAVFTALDDANLEKQQLSHSVFGLAGADRPSDFNYIHQMIEKLDIGSYDIYNDGLIALKAGNLAFEGMVIICGTATNAIGRNEKGEIHQLGGFGYNFGDYGGGHQLSKEIFRTVIRSYEGRETDTLLTELVLEQLGFHDVQDMYEYYLDQKDNLPLHLSPTLFKAASQGDSLANKLMDKQAIELTKSTQALTLKMKSKLKPLPLILVGSVLNKSHDDLMYKRFISKINELNLNLKIVTLKEEPVIGAILLAINSSRQNEREIRNTVVQTLRKERVS